MDQVTNKTSLIYYGGHSGSTGHGYSASEYDSSGMAFLLFTIIVGYLHRAFRTFHVLPGSAIEDCGYSFWCSCCALSQMSAHVARAKHKRQTFAATLPAYESE